MGGETWAPCGLFGIHREVTRPKIHDTLGPSPSHSPWGRSGTSRKIWWHRASCFAISSCKLHCWNRFTGRPCLLPHWPTDFQVSTLEYWKCQGIMGLIHHCRPRTSKGTCYRNPASTSASSARASKDKLTLSSVGGEQGQAVPSSFPGVFPVGIQHPSPSRTENLSYLAGSLDLEEVDRGCKG